MRSLEEIKRDNLDRSRGAAIAASRVPRVICTRCDGAGHHALNEPHANVYGVLTGEWQVTEAVREQLHALGDLVAPTALINRLQYLVVLRLADTRLSPTNKRRREWRVR